MKRFRDYEGRIVRLTDERWVHVQEHPEAHLYHRFYFGTRVGDKYLCVVVKVHGEDAFVLTAYLTDQIRKGDMIWRARS